MPLPLAVLLLLLAQIGPTGTRTQAPLEIPRHKSVLVQPATAPSPAASRLNECLTLARSEPASAVTVAEAWRDSLKGSQRAAPGQCLGLALTGLTRWDDAEAAFVAARDDTPANARGERARLGAMAANAALVDGAPGRALALLDTAHGEALGAGDAHLAAEVAIDRARALVALKRDGDAAAALAEARSGAPANAVAWLLSATFQRRQGKLVEAQGYIEQAAALAPLDSEVGLEAGVIAVLGGRDGAARRSWQSVIAGAPDSDAAKTAKQYLDQLGPDAAPSAR